MHPWGTTAVILCGTLLLTACGGAGATETPRIMGGERDSQSARPSAFPSEPPTQEPASEGAPNIVPPVAELPEDVSPATPPTTVQAQPSPSFPLVTAEEVFQVLKDHGLFYKTDQDYENTAEALTRDGGFEEWVGTVREEAQNEYPAAAEELGRGLTMEEIMEPWIAIYANKKGISPNIVDWEQNDLLRYIVALDEWPTVEEFSTMVENVSP